jgi:hypothetical protein
VERQREAVGVRVAAHGPRVSAFFLAFCEGDGLRHGTACRIAEDAASELHAPIASPERLLGQPGARGSAADERGGGSAAASRGAVGCQRSDDALVAAVDRGGIGGVCVAVRNRAAYPGRRVGRRRVGRRRGEARGRHGALAWAGRLAMMRCASRLARGTGGVPSRCSSDGGSELCRDRRPRARAARSEIAARVEDPGCVRRALRGGWLG